MRAGGIVRLQLPRLRHAFARGAARDRVPGGVRCHPLGAGAGWNGSRVGRTARVRRGARPGRGGSRRLGDIHGDPSESRRSPERRSERGPARRDGAAARDPDGDRSRGQAPPRRAGNDGECPDEPAARVRPRRRAHRRGARARDHRFARKPHRGGGCRARGGRRRNRLGAVRRVDRGTRGGRVARRRSEAIRRQRCRSGGRQRRAGDRSRPAGRAGRGAGPDRRPASRA